MGERARTTSAGDARGAAHTVSEALTVARSIERASFRAWGLSVVASAQASTGDVQVALATARSIQRAIRRNSALRAVAGAQAKAGDIEGVLSTAASIEDVPTHAWALRDIAKAQRDAANVRSEPDGDSTKWAAPTSSNTPVSENVALEGPWTAYAEGRGHDHRSQYFGLAWGRSTEAEAAAAATDACIRKAGADLTDNCDYSKRCGSPTYHVYERSGVR